MSTYNMDFQYKIRALELSQIILISAIMGKNLGTQERIRRGKRAIGIRAIEVLLQILSFKSSLPQPSLKGEAKMKMMDCVSIKIDFLREIVV